jgi:predicted metal-dependent hydrolase
MPHSSLEKAVVISLHAGDERIAVHLEKDRHKTIRLKVKPDGTVLARAPYRSRQEDVLAWLTGRATWILARQEYFQRLRAALPVPGYAPGHIQRFLGQDYTLHIAPHVRGEVRLDGRGFHIRTRGAVNQDKVQALLDRWFQDQASVIFAERLALWFPDLQAQAGASLLSAAQPQLKVRPMRSRYGSCNRQGVITLNRYLAAMPLACVDYVLVHELCHLRHFAHDRSFYKLLQKLLPDWKERRAMLKRYWFAQF